jgi:hypothetical protein
MKTVTQANFVRGINAATGKVTVVQGSVRRISNFDYTRRGSLLTIDGTKGISTSGGWPSTAGANLKGPVAIIAAAVGSGPALPVALTINGEYASNPGILQLWDISGITASTISLVPPAGGSPSTFWGGFTYPIGSIAERLPQLLNVNGLLVGCIGSDVYPLFANLFTGTSGIVGSNSDYPLVGAAHGCFHQSVLWLWNTASVDGVLDGPSTLRMCSVDASGNPDITNFPRLNQAFIDRSDGTQGQGLISFTSAEAGIAPTATLVLFKDYSTYQVTGLLTPGGGYSVTKAQTDMGCVAPRTIRFAPGFGVVRMTHFGVSVFDGANDKLISEEVRPYLFQTEPEIQSFDWTRVSQAYAAVTVNPPTYAVALPMPGIGGLSRVLKYDLVLKQWSVVDFLPPSTSTPGPIRVIETMKLGSRKPVTYISDWQALYDQFPAQACAGYIRKWMDGDPDWDGTPISWMVRPPPVFSENPTTPFYVRRANVRARTMAAKINGLFDLSNTQARSSAGSGAYSYLAATSLYGSGIYGSSTYGYPIPDLVIPLDVGAKVWSVDVQLTGSGPVEIMAIDWQIEPKPPVARPRIS